MILTIHSALRGTEGELVPMIGREPQPISPAVWLTSASNSIACSTDDGVCQYDFQYSQTTIGHATDELKIGVLDAKVENGSKSNADAFLWVAWRYASPERTQVSSKGFLLDSARSQKPFIMADVASWNPKAAWSFQQPDFVRNHEIVYRSFSANGWKRETWVRRLDPLPYRDIYKETIVGYTCFQQTFVPGAGSSVRILVPYQPLPIEDRDRLNVLSLQPVTSPEKPKTSTPAAN